MELVVLLLIPAIPLSLMIMGMTFERLLTKMLNHQRDTLMVGGQPLALIKQQMEDQKEAAFAARESESEALEALRQRRREAMGS